MLPDSTTSALPALPLPREAKRITLSPQCTESLNHRELSDPQQRLAAGWGLFPSERVTQYTCLLELLEEQGEYFVGNLRLGLRADRIQNLNLGRLPGFLHGNSILLRFSLYFVVAAPKCQLG